MKAIKTKGVTKRTNVICYGVSPSDDFVLSGFSGTKNAVLPSDFAPNSNPWEMVFKVTTGSNVTTAQQIIGGTTSNYGALELGITTKSKFVIWLGSTSANGIANGTTGTYTVLANTTYWVKVVFSGSAYTVSYSLNGKDFTTDKIINSTATIGGSGKSIGADRKENDSPFLGLIDLKQCYININGERWWSGVVDVEVDKYKVFGVRKRTIKQANVTCYAIAPTEDFVLSGFSGSNYAVITDSFAVGTNTWEMVYKIRTGTDITTVQSICGHTGSSTYDPVNINIKSSKVALGILSSGTESKIAGTDILGQTTVLTDTDYWVKLVFDGAKYVLSSSTNGIDYAEEVVVESTKTIWTSNLVLGRQQGADSEYPFLGSIDLKGCYINVNGRHYWSGVKGVLVDRYLMAR